MSSGPADTGTNAQSQAHAQETDRLRLHFSSSKDSTQYAGRWESLWHGGVFLPWDRGEASPALIDVLAQRQDLVGSAVVAPGQLESNNGPRRKALIPGCGVGYDCYLLQAQGWDVVGLDISETAIQRAKAYQNRLEGQKVFAAGQFGKGTLRFESGDFFALDEEVWMGQWDLIWDYTVCALIYER